MFNDTIAAISTAMNDAGIGIVRVSGSDAILVCSKLYRNKDGVANLSSYKSHTIHYGFIYDNETLVDEVMVSIMKAPNTFTREDVVEINCHGGVIVVKKILDLVLRSGARLAESGEFTKRAFLNGRIDLSKAEAVMDLISAGNNAAVSNSLKHLEGKLYSKIKDLREKILYEIAFIESALDDPEHISLDDYPERLSSCIGEWEKEIQYLYDSFSKGKLVKEGIRTVIVGKPNVGKSSLLNSLVGKERAIVTDIAGTTRDVLEESVFLNDVSLTLIDTAGIRNTDDVVENIGVERAKKFAKDADLVLFLLDVTASFSKEDEEIFEYCKDKKMIVLFNKSDKDAVMDINSLSNDLFKGIPTLNISAKESVGIKELEQLIKDMFFEGSISSDNELYITNIRQAGELSNCLNSLSLVKKSLSENLPEDFYSIDLTNAYSSLGKIIGEDIDDDLATEIFSKFCLGK